jgi:hypothetical protein
MVKKWSQNIENMEAKLKEVEESQMKYQCSKEKAYSNYDSHVNQKHY